MNLTELSDLLSAATDVLRVETLDAYSSPSDVDYVERFRAGEPKPDPSEKQPWLDRLTAAAERGHPWRRLRVVSRPVTEYVRYACEWGYVDNVAAGEDVRVLDEDEDYIDQITCLGDFWVIDDNDVYVMAYDEHGAFVEVHAERPRSETYLSKAHYGWKHATAFSDWWAANLPLHRSLASA